MFENGDKVTLKRDWADEWNPNEVFTVTNADGDSCFIADSNGRGWSVKNYQIDLVEKSAQIAYDIAFGNI
jgi:hypothetical protein